MKHSERIGDFWGDAVSVVKPVMPYVHTAGKIALSAFGAGVLAQPIEQLEQQAGLLPVAGIIVSNPDYVVVVRASSSDVLQNVAQAFVTGGRRFEGNGYVQGNTRTFSFGVDGPQQVIVTRASGAKSSFTDAKQVLFLGGVESSTTSIKGEIMKPVTSYRSAPDQAKSEFYLLGTDVLGADLDNEEIIGAVTRPSSGKPKQAPPARLHPVIVKAGKALDAKKKAESAGKAAIARAKRFNPAKVKPIAYVAPKALGKATTVLGAIPILGAILGAIGSKAQAAEQKARASASKAQGAVKKQNDAVKKFADRAKKSESKGSAALDAAKKAGEVAAKAKAAVESVRQGKHVVAGDFRVFGDATLHEIIGDEDWLNIIGQEEIEDNVQSTFQVSGDFIGDDGWNEIVGDDASGVDDTDPSILWHKVPADGIVYDGAKGWPRYSKGSVSYYFGPTKEVGMTPGDGGLFGMIWGYDHMNWPNSGDPMRWIWRYGQDGANPTDVGTAMMVGQPWAAFIGLLGNDKWSDGFASDAAASKKSIAVNGGPLVGNPKDPDFAGLRYATDDDKWFYPLSLAPSWARAEMDKAAADAEKAKQDAEQAAADAAQAQADQDAAEQAEAQAKLDAELALKQQEADAEAAIAAQKADTEAAAAQSQLDIQQAQAEQQYQAQQMQLDIEAQKAALEYAKAHPEAVEQAPQGGGDDGGAGFGPGTTDRSDPFGDGGGVDAGGGGSDEGFPQAPSDFVDPFASEE